jgi:cytochrome b pre-mRNA-processing protein 3
MNLTFPMALYYYASAAAGIAAARPPACLAATSRFWQARMLSFGAAAAVPARSSERPTMILKLFGKSAVPEAVYGIYRAIVAQSRRPVFYAEWGVPDTVTGRFDMISLHLVLLLRRLRGESEAAKRFSQSVFDLFFKDMDRSLREMGAGDLSVPKKIKSMGNLFYGLLAALNTALDKADPAQVRAVLVRNVYGGEDPPGAAALAAYLMDESGRLAKVPLDTLLAGDLALGEAA